MIHSASFRDPSGFVFVQNQKIYRQVNHSYQPHYDHLMDSGLYARLVKDQLLIAHQEADHALAITSDAYKVIQPEAVPFISYPYEWCFSQLKAAALATLRIQMIALDYGMQLKDASAYNIQFIDGKPLLIDTLSFENYADGQPWTAYRQFCQHFFAPLALMHYCDARLSQLLRVHLDGIPLDLAAKLLPRRSFLHLSLLLHIHFHSRGQRAFTDHEASARSQALSKQAMLNLIDNLMGGIERLRWEPEGSAWNWTDYEQGDSYSTVGADHKCQLVETFVTHSAAQTAWDLGANTGGFSRILSERGIFTVACDVDAGAVERNYRRMVETGENKLHPLLIDLTNPSAAIGWANQERAAFGQRGKPDLILALALVHHLAITNNVPLEHIAREFAALGQWLIIELVPKSDKKVQQLLMNRADIFPDYNQTGFETAFTTCYDIVERQSIADSERILYLMRVKSHA